MTARPVILVADDSESRHLAKPHARLLGELLTERGNNWLAAVVRATGTAIPGTEEERWGLAACDVTTGECLASAVCGTDQSCCSLDSQCPFRQVCDQLTNACVSGCCGALNS